MATPTPSIPSITEKLLIKSIADCKGSGKRYAFLLGAGASITSGIPGAYALAKKWLDELQEDNPDAYKKITQTPQFKDNNLGALYSKIYDTRFEKFPNDGYQAIEQAMSANSVQPSFGYTVLAQVLEKTRHNIVLTTNFDRLVETSLLIYQGVHARVIAHEAMLPFQDVSDQKPSIMKVHRDMFTKPSSQEGEVSKLPKIWHKPIQKLLQNYHLIAIGYGGHDDGLLKIIKKHLQTIGDAKIFWCHIEPSPPQEIATFANGLKGKNMEKVCTVRIQGFDEFMLKLNKKLEYPLLVRDEDNEIEKQAKQRSAAYKRQVEELQRKLQTKDIDTELKSSIKKLLANTWWEVESAVKEEKDIAQKEQLYLAGMKKFPQSHELIGNYATFLWVIRKAYDRAESFYKKALEIDRNDANINGNFASFLHDIRKDYDQAESFYKKALEIDPNDANINGNFANFLWGIRKNYDQAESFYNQALKLAPNHANSNGNYASFLWNARKDYGQAESFYKKALELAPNDADINVNYAGFLLARGRRKEALTFLQKADEAADRDDLRLELSFYRLAHFPQEAQQARAKIAKLLAQGVRSPNWDFSGNIEQAKREGCSYVPELESLAAQINQSPP
ncbi:MAG: tetratricopeptide repeat protein [Cytophagales bacterium]|nr:tetratricopeptide repeat protein [Cytophagales bacterium]